MSNLSKQDLEYYNLLFNDESVNEMAMSFEQMY